MDVSTLALATGLIATAAATTLFVRKLLRDRATVRRRLDEIKNSRYHAGGFVRSSGLRDGEIPVILKPGEHRIYPGHRLFAAPSPRPAANGPELSPVRLRSNSSGRCWLCDGELEHTADCPRGILLDIAAEKGRPTYRSVEPDHGLIESDRPIHPIQAMQDEGDLLAVPPMPNMGGEGNPDYAGPHYETPADYPTEALYELHRDPPEGAAVRPAGEHDQ